MSVVAALLSASLALPATQMVSGEGPQMMVQDDQAPVTYRATRRDRTSRAYPEIRLQCSGREMHFRISGLPLPNTGHTPVQAQIGSWSEPLYRPVVTEPHLIAQTSPALLAAVRGHSQMVIRANNRTYRLRPLDSHQHAVFARGCAMSRDASVGPNPPQQLRPEERLLD